MFVYHFVDLDLRVGIFFEKEGAAKNGEVDFEILAFVLKVKENFMQRLSVFFIVFVNKKKALKSSLSMCYYSLIIEFFWFA